MVFICGKINCCVKGASHQTLDNTKEVKDKSAEELSYVGKAAYNILRTKHAWHHHKLWNVTSGEVIGSLHQTPKAEVFRTSEDPKECHDEWFPQEMYKIMVRTQSFCDIMSLGPPDGLFLEKLQEGLRDIAKNAESSTTPVIVRFLMGNIIGMPVNCNKLIKTLAKKIPAGSNIHLWVGSWRKGASWNHAKLIAVDGRYLHTGGHNLWDDHYLKGNPVHDLSVEMEGRVTHDAHLYANSHWAFICKKQDTFIGQIAEKIPDGLPLVWKNRVIVSEYPRGRASEFPPQYHTGLVHQYDKPKDSVPIISVGRNGRLTFRHRPADDAFIQMFDAAKKIIRMSLQDIGPVCIPKTKIALPGLTWPKPYLDALARAIKRGVDVEIILSNPGSIPSSLTLLDAQYGNGWSCVDCAAEIIKRIKKKNPFCEVAELRKMVTENLRISYIRHNKSRTYKDGRTIGNHSKFFIIDDIAAYIGSQNLYLADLAEWGVIVDHEDETGKMIEDFWNPLWEASYDAEDCDVGKVIDGLNINRDGERINMLKAEGRKQMENNIKMGAPANGQTDFLFEERVQEKSRQVDIESNLTPPEAIEVTRTMSEVPETGNRLDDQLPPETN